MLVLSPCSSSALCRFSSFAPVSPFAAFGRRCLRRFCPVIEDGWLPEEVVPCSLSLIASFLGSGFVSEEWLPCGGCRWLLLSRFLVSFLAVSGLLSEVLDSFAFRRLSALLFSVSAFLSFLSFSLLLLPSLRFSANASGFFAFLVPSGSLVACFAFSALLDSFGFLPESGCFSSCFFDLSGSFFFLLSFSLLLGGGSRGQYH